MESATARLLETECCPGAVAPDRPAVDRAWSAEWAGLESAATLPTQNPAFLAALAESLLAETDIEVFRAAGAKGIVAQLPLCRDRAHFARWRVAGAREVFEPVDALCDDNAAAQALARLIAGQSRPVVLDRMPADSSFIPALQAAMLGRGWLRISPAIPCPTIALDDRWCEPESRFNSGRRSDFRRAARRAAELGETTFEVLSPDPALFEALFDEAIAVELASWKQEAGTAIAVDRDKEAFFRAFFRAAAEAGTLRMAFMRIGGRAVAMQLALEWHGRFWLFKIGYDESFGKCSPGTLLMLHTLGWAAQRGLCAYELMGNVEAWIADFWTREAHACVTVKTYPRNLRGAVAFFADAVQWAKGRWPGRGQQ